MGRMVYTAPERPSSHDCEPPMTGLGEGQPFIPQPTAPPGSVWQCDCGRYWTATETCWRPSSRRERRKAERPATGLVTVVDVAPVPVPYPVSAEHPPVDFGG
jgi:hypothetical protein